MEARFPIIDFIERTFTLANEPFKLYPYQKKFLLDKFEQRIVNKARQVGMSTIIAIEALLKCANPEKTVLIVSVSDRQALNIMRKIHYFLGQTKDKEWEFIKDKPRNPFLIRDETKREIVFHNGSRLVSLPNNPSTVRGYRAHFAYIDEFAHFEKDQDMMNAIEPSLSRGGKITLVSTPFGKRGVFYNILEKAKELGYSKHEVPWTECPDEKYQKKIERKKKQMDLTSFAQEYELKFISEALSFFPYGITLPCVDDNLHETWKLVTNKPVQMGIDFGQKSSQSVAITIEKTEKTVENKKVPMLIVRNIKAWRLGTPFHKIEKDIENMYGDLNPSMIYVDQTGLGLKITEDLRRKIGAAIRGVNFTNPMKDRMATNLRTIFENEQIRIPRNTVLLHQLNNLERTISELGTIRYKHSKGEHDDYVWSLCLACFGMTRPKPFMGVR